MFLDGAGGHLADVKGSKVRRGTKQAGSAAAVDGPADSEGPVLGLRDIPGLGMAVEDGQRGLQAHHRAAVAVQ